MDVLHLVTSNNTIINTNSKQTIKYSISTIRSILSIPHIHIFQGSHMTIHTFGTLGSFLTTLNLYFLNLVFTLSLSETQNGHSLKLL